MNTHSVSMRLAPEVQAAVAVFLENYQPGGGPFIISEAIKAVRQVYPLMDLSDNDLTDAIAGQAVATGFNIYFDGTRKPNNILSLARWENEGGATGKLAKLDRRDATM